MSILPVRLFGDPVLRKHAEPVEDIDATIAALVKNMYVTQARQKGIGLAAPQVGLSRRLFVVDTTELITAGSSSAYLNPELIGTYGEVVYEEGCLSFPGIHLDICRPRQIGLRFVDLEGKEHTLDADGILARIILHELDHLEGRLFIDMLPEEAQKQVVALLRERGVIATGP